jgi:hypothetical protein
MDRTAVESQAAIDPDHEEYLEGVVADLVGLAED